MEAVAAAMEGLAPAEWLRHSRWAYAAVNTTHVFGIALLVGAVVPLDLRLLGLWASVELRALYRVLARVAATGLVLAIASGALLLSVRATEYAAMDLFRAKMALVAIGVLHAAGLHFSGGFPAASRAGRRLAGALSLLVWIAVLICGRLLAYV